MASSGDGGPGEQYKGRIYSSSSKRPYQQDLAPKGGYAPITFKRIPARTVLSAKALFGGFIALNVYATWRIMGSKKKIERDDLERRSSELALEPMLCAERDREYLKQLRKNRDAETDVMAHVPGWEVGTYFGQPVYKTVPDST